MELVILTVKNFPQHFDDKAMKIVRILYKNVIYLNRNHTRMIKRVWRYEKCHNMARWLTGQPLTPQWSIRDPYWLCKMRLSVRNMRLWSLHRATLHEQYSIANTPIAVPSIPNFPRDSGWLLDEVGDSIKDRNASFRTHQSPRKRFGIEPVK